MQDTPDQRSVRQQELEIERAKLEIERAKLAFEFAKYGFAGTLTAALVGAGVILGLAILSAFTPFKIETWGLVAIAVVIMIGAIAFGFLSLWELPRIVARYRDLQFTVSGTDGQSVAAQVAALNAAGRRRESVAGSGERSQD